MATPLEDVGKQVSASTRRLHTALIIKDLAQFSVAVLFLTRQIWRGAFLLSDFILSNPAAFRGATVLELGAGTGLASIIAASAAKTVYCTGTVKVLEC